MRTKSKMAPCCPPDISYIPEGILNTILMMTSGGELQALVWFGAVCELWKKVCNFSSRLRVLSTGATEKRARDMVFCIELFSQLRTILLLKI
jgi:hypothetical protein